MKISGITLCFIAITLIGATGCRTTRYIPVRGETNIETRYIEKIETIQVDVMLPSQHIVNMAVDSVSHLETDIARSDAWIDSVGRLHHSLDNKHRTVLTKVPVRTITRDSIIYCEHPIPFPVERELSIWERIKMKWGGWALVTVTALLIFRTTVQQRHPFN